MNRMNQYDSKGNDPIREKLRQLEAKSLELQKQGKYGESLDILEEAFHLKINAYGEDSEEVLKTSEKLCELCNLIAMVCLTRGRNEACFEFLKKARVLCENSFNFKAVTYNNMACYYKRIKKNRVALDYLKKALEIEIHIDRPQSLADTHLNLCAVLSQLEKHKEALEHVLMSIVLLQEEHMQNILQHGNPRQRQQNMQNSENQDPNDNADGDYQNNEMKGQNGDQGNRNFDDRIAVLAIAYHNMGVELEFLGRFEEAIQTYKKAVNFSITYLGENHTLVENLKGVLAQAENQIQTQKSKEIRRREGKDINKKPSIRINQAQNAYNTSELPFKRATTAKSAPGGGNFRITSAQSQNNPQQMYKAKLPAMQQQQNMGSSTGFPLQGTRSPTQQRPMTSNYPSQGARNMNQGQMNQNYYPNSQYDNYPPQQQQQQQQQPNYLMSNNNQQFAQNELMNQRGDHSRQEISPDQYSNQNN